ncbi:hypothetical protein GGR51DRAFT_200282 [Nemania sp. FL0031]|nr:hypothetical protein GGR51DRAFT_200282 [Nemania sp. FL0031]
MAALTKGARENFVTSAALIPLVSLFVALRFGLKIFRRQAIQGPDWMCLFSATIFNVGAALIINFIFNVSRFHEFDLDFSLGDVESANRAKIIYITEILFGFGITSIKLSILWFYYKLFSIDQKLRRVIIATTIVSILWFIVSTLVIVLQCVPVRLYFETFASPEYCLSYPRVLFGYELTNLFVDVAVLCIPTTAVWQLQLPRAKKVTFTFIFLLGGLVCIFSILRITAVWNPPNIYEDFNFPLSYVWSSLQWGLAIITSCLPLLGPLLPPWSIRLPSIASWYESIRSRLSRNRSSGRHDPLGITSSKRTWDMIGGNRHNETSQAWVSDDGFTRSQYALLPIPSRAILVDRENEIV